MPQLGPFEFIIILVIFMIFFGAGKLGNVGGAIGKGIQEFKKNAGIGQDAKKDGETPSKRLSALNSMPEAVTGVILAGGRASRLGGIDKSALDIDGLTVIERVIAALSTVAERLIVVANDARFDADPRLTVIRDPDPHAGVSPALQAALSPPRRRLRWSSPATCRSSTHARSAELVRLAGAVDAVCRSSMAAPSPCTPSIGPSRAALPSARRLSAISAG